MTGGDRLGEVQPTRNVIGLQLERAFEELLAEGPVAAEGARDLAQELAAGDEHVGIVRRERRGAVDLPVQALEPVEAPPTEPGDLELPSIARSMEQA